MYSSNSSLLLLLGVDFECSASNVAAMVLKTKM